MFRRLFVLANVSLLACVGFSASYNLSVTYANFDGPGLRHLVYQSAIKNFSVFQNVFVWPVVVADDTKHTYSNIHDFYGGMNGCFDQNPNPYSASPVFETASATVGDLFPNALDSVKNKTLVMNCRPNSTRFFLRGGCE